MASRAYDSRIVWLLATCLALLGIAIGVVDGLQRIDAVPLWLAPQALLVLVVLLFIDDSAHPRFWLTRDVPRIAWTLAVSAAALAAAIVLIIRLGGTTLGFDSNPAQTAHVLQTVLCFGVFIFAGCASWVQIHWARATIIDTSRPQPLSEHTLDQLAHDQHHDPRYHLSPPPPPPPATDETNQPWMIVSSLSRDLV